VTSPLTNIRSKGSWGWTLEAKKQISAPAIQFKGSGFYKTDYSSSSKPDSKSGSKPSESKSESKTETKSESKTETKSDSSKTSD